eukprot:scaffold13602_cov131-Isochrysis_galbana.AAC.4
MAPRRPGTQPTEADPTLDIGAKRARVVGEDESSTQGSFFFRVDFFITLCQPDISTHISISAAQSVSSHTDRASRIYEANAGV